VFIHTLTLNIGDVSLWGIFRGGVYVRLQSINPLSASENPFCAWIVQLDKKNKKKA